MTDCKRHSITFARDNTDHSTGPKPPVRGKHGFAALMATALLLLSGLSACTPYAVAPLGRYSESGYHTVKKGENVYAIAVRYGLDYHELAIWNRIDPPSFLIYPGQKLRLFEHTNSRRTTKTEQPEIRHAKTRRAKTRQPPPSEKLVLIEPSPSPSKGSTAPKVPSPTPKSASSRTGKNTDKKAAKRTVKTTKIKKTVPKKTPAKPKKKHDTRKKDHPPKKPQAKKENNPKRGWGTKTKDGAKWHWPSRGKLLHNFAQSGNRGLDIAGSFGSPVYAAANGKVVYTGSGLRGYGKLIIIKHNRRYLSAYANNHRMLVKEGMRVAGGQKIAEMGRQGANPAMLHFEIRKKGRPVNPIKYLKTH
uniref:Lipoprotein NlpD n=1 Tax=Candidatus Kentrum sp. SD TaxID=2126332 RepID=A0A451BPR7_9GAMM|nr:MAG: lipoprotein NlpD [Candidatus Kentron sp. SD]